MVARKVSYALFSEYTYNESYGMMCRNTAASKEAVVAYLRYYVGICVNAMRKTTKMPSKRSQFTSRDLMPGPPNTHSTDTFGATVKWKGMGREHNVMGIERKRIE